MTDVPPVPDGVAVLAPFVEAHIFDASEVHLAATITRLSPGISDEVVLALAVAARGPRLGHVCVDLHDVERQLGGDRDREPGSGPDAAALEWPAVERWTAELHASDIVAAPADSRNEPLLPIVFDGRRIYLQRYWHYESLVAEELRVRASVRGSTSITTLSGADPTAVGPPPPSVTAALDRFFGPDTGTEPDLQRRAAQVALSNGLAVIVGGPGTGKTRTVARLLAAAQLVAVGEGRPLQVALAAPTGKAAARMTEAVRAAVDEIQAESVAAGRDPLPPEFDDLLRSTEATTLHRLLGRAPGTRFRHDRSNPLPHDLVVVDETSMVALPLMARLLDAVRPEARLVLVGDPFQLASVEAGTVLGDVVGPALDPDVGPALDPDVGPALDPSPLAGHVSVLRRTRRFADESGIAALADAIRLGDADTALEVLDGSHPDTSWVGDHDVAGLAELERLVVDAGVEVVMAALAGLAGTGLEAANRVKVLAATRHRQLGLYDWSDRIESAIARRVPELQRNRRWYVGRPVMVTANEALNRIANGDVGLVVAHGDGLAVVFPVGDDMRYVPPSRLDRIETWWAMTIHKSQGSEFPHAVVSLPPADSPILTRELLYTAVTRAQERVTVVGSEQSLRAAIERPIARASGLRDRLWPNT